jgi:prolipoprotein diacylglyceryltransferase
VALLLLWIPRSFTTRLKRGDLITLYFIFSPIGRIITEFFRLDSVSVFNLSLAQMLSAVMVAAALMIFLYRHRTELFHRASTQPSSEMT